MIKIAINEALTREYTDKARGDRKVVYFTLTETDGTEHKMIEDIPGDADPQGYLEANADAQLLFVRHEEYSNKAEGLSTLEAMEEWIAGGCVLTRAVKGNFVDRWE